MSLNPYLPQVSRTLRSSLNSGFVRKSLLENVCGLITILVDYPPYFPINQYYLKEIRDLFPDRRELNSLLENRGCTYPFFEKLVSDAVKQCLERRDVPRLQPHQGWISPPQLILGDLVHVPSRLFEHPISTDNLELMDLLVTAGAQSPNQNHRLVLLRALLGPPPPEDKYFNRWVKMPSGGIK